MNEENTKMTYNGNDTFPETVTLPYNPETFTTMWNGVPVYKGTLIAQNDFTRRQHPLMDISKAPAINVMDMDTFRNRVSQIFQITSEVLAKSYGPYGSSTIISDYPFKHVTKDGFSIMKKLSFSKDTTIIDDAIKGLIEGPCARLNYAVGDGTTTSIIAVNAIYQQYEKKFCHSDLAKKYPPRDILKAYEKVRDKIISELNNEIQMIDTSNHEAMVSEMVKIANISSNGDEEITKLIHDLYDELDYPLIEITKAKDGITKKTVTHGYHYKAVLKDGVYINNDGMTGEYKNVDVLIFDHKITSQTFDKIINPLNVSCNRMGRNLVIIAPSYDEVAMMSQKELLMGEKRATGKINLILLSAGMVNGLARNLTEDLAMLLNTTIINMGFEKYIVDEVNKGTDLLEILDISNRHIKGINIPSLTSDGKNYTWKNDDGEYFEPCVHMKEKHILVGFAADVNLGMNMEIGSVFNGFHYDEDLYNKTVLILEKTLDEANKKSESVSTYNFEARDIQTRLFNLKMNIGTIEVGGESVLSQELLYDAVDDTVKATSSAYHNGTVKGCSVSTLRAIKKFLDSTDDRDHLETILFHYIFEGFREVYRTLLSSKYENIFFNDSIDDEMMLYDRYDKIRNNWDWNVDTRTFDEAIHKAYKMFNGLPDNAFDLIIDMSIASNLPFDLSTSNFNADIINSAKTDKEILLASSDLISLLITGNQFILADHM